MMADNANSKRLTARVSIRRGSTLLNGLLRCGHCGRKLSVGYGKGSSRYYCHGRTHLHGGKLCISFGALRVDESVSAEVLRQIQPMGVEAALSAIEARESETNDVRRQVELALEQARYESNRAQRQYHAVDPEIELSQPSLSVCGMNDCWLFANLRPSCSRSIHSIFRR